MAELFQHLSAYDGVHAATFPVHAPYDASIAPRGTWPSEHGSPAQTSTAGEPLTADLWSKAWEAPLDAIGAPADILVGAGTVVVNAEEGRGVFTTSGRAIGKTRRLMGSSFLDVTGKRLLGQDDEAGITTYTLTDAKRDATLMLAFPMRHRLQTVIAGPDVLVFLTLEDLPYTQKSAAVVEAVRIHDYGNKSQARILRGAEPLGGIIRTQDAQVRMAAARSGPILATPDGIRWCDWQLRPLHETRGHLTPLALSGDGTGRALLVFEQGGTARFAIIAPGKAPTCDVKLPWSPAMPTPPPIITLNGSIVLTPPGRFLLLGPEGQTLHDETRPSRAPGSLSSNGILLLPAAELLGVGPDGHRHVLWKPPSAIATAPVLADGHIYVATEEKLYALRAG